MWNVNILLTRVHGKMNVPAFLDLFNQIRDSYKKYAPQLDDSKNPFLEALIKPQAVALFPARKN